jgi:hypothetical protein
MARTAKLTMSPELKSKVYDRFTALRTSPLCRDKDKNLLVDKTILDLDPGGVTDDVSLALCELMQEWCDNFTNEKMAAMQNGHSEEPPARTKR